MAVDRYSVVNVVELTYHDREMVNFNGESFEQVHFRNGR